MSQKDQILSIVVSEQQYMASILSSEAINASQSAYWTSLISAQQIIGEPIDSVIGQIIGIQKSVSSVINAAADKEFAIAAKVSAVMGKASPVIRVQCATKCAPAANLLTNGDFEDIGTGVPALIGWNATNATPHIQPAGLPTDYFSGSVVAGLGANSSLSQNVPVQGGCSYQLSFALSALPISVITLQVDFFQNSNLISTFSRTIVGQLAGYNTFVYLFKLPATINNVTITFIKPGNLVEAFIDLVSFGVQ